MENYYGAGSFATSITIFYRSIYFGIILLYYLYFHEIIKFKISMWVRISISDRLTYQHLNIYFQ